VTVRPLDSPYVQCEWRKASALHCGWLLDIATHGIAALRLIFDDFLLVGDTTLVREEVDGGVSETVSAPIRLSNDVQGNLTFLYEVKPKIQPVFDVRIEVVGTEGRLLADRNSLRHWDGQGREQKRREYHCLTVSRCISAFVEAIQDRVPVNNDNPLHPERALFDLKILERIREPLLKRIA
jgi:predicted dehydrogenase